MTRPPLAHDDRLSWHKRLSYWRFDTRDSARTVIIRDTLDEMRQVIDEMDAEGRLPPYQPKSSGPPAA